MGSIVVKLPLPPSCLPTLWQQDERFHESYLAEFPGYYKTADAGFKDEDGYLYVMSRTDDIINVAGHRLSTGGMEEVLAAPQGRRRMRGRSASRTRSRARCRRASSVLKAGVNRPRGRDRAGDASRLRAREDRPGRGLQARHHGRRGCRRRARARSSRGTMKKIADGEPWTMPATIDDPAILDEIGTRAEGGGGNGVARACNSFGMSARPH